MWEQRHSLSDKITQAKTVLVRIQEVLTSGQESLDLHRRCEELLGRLESEVNFVSVIVESEEFHETEEAVRARREKVEADNRDLQELIKKLAMLTSPAGKLTNTFFVIKVNDWGFSHRVSLNSRKNVLTQRSLKSLFFI